MNVDDMILVSIDDHSIEPSDMYEPHVPAKHKGHAPKIVRNDQGVDTWETRSDVTRRRKTS